MPEVFDAALPAVRARRHPPRDRRALSARAGRRRARRRSARVARTARWSSFRSATLCASRMAARRIDPKVILTVGVRLRESRPTRATSRVVPSECFPRLPSSSLLVVAAAAPALARAPVPERRSVRCINSTVDDSGRGLRHPAALARRSGTSRSRSAAPASSRSWPPTSPSSPARASSRPAPTATTTVTLDATGTIDIQSQGTSKSKIDVSGNFGGGTINLHVGRQPERQRHADRERDQPARLRRPDQHQVDTGNVTDHRRPERGHQVVRQRAGRRRLDLVEATLGSITVSTQLVPKGGDCGSCEVDLTAGPTSPRRRRA